MDYEKVKKIISSVIISNPNGTTIFQLERDFKYITGKEIPYRLWGFESVSKYLCSIPDICRIIRCDRGSFATIEPVLNSYNIHMNDLVLCQDVKPKEIVKKEDNRLHNQIVKKPISKIIIPKSEGVYLSVKNGPTLLINESNVLIFTFPTDKCRNLYRQKGPIDGLLMSREIEKRDFNYVAPTKSTSRQYTPEPNNVLIPHESSTFDYVTKVNDKDKKKFKSLIENFPNGMELMALRFFYLQKFKEPLRLEDFNVNTILEICKDIPKVFHTVRTDRVNWSIYDATRPKPSPNFPETSETQQTPAYLLQFEYPEYVLKPGETVQPMNLLHKYRMYDRIEVHIHNINNPLDLTFCLHHDDESNEDFKQFTAKIQNFYKYSNDHLVLNEYILKIGLFVVALWENEFCRAVIIRSFITHSYAEVYLIDYGLSCYVPICDMHLLHRQFASKKQQAIQGRLFNINYPSKTKRWSESAIALCKKFVKEEVLYAKIEEWDLNQIVEITLDKKNLRMWTLSLNEELIEAGYAQLLYVPSTEPDKDSKEEEGLRYVCI